MIGFLFNSGPELLLFEVTVVVSDWVSHRGYGKANPIRLPAILSGMLITDLLGALKLV
jgi:hypothetical protein